jgi:hypothetical protein
MTGVHNVIAGNTGGNAVFLYDIIQEMGLTANLNFCLDVGDTRCTDGTSQTWTDASGNSNNFFRGNGGGIDAGDPSFVGTAGSSAESTYWSFDGGDWFEEASNLTFANGWHKDNGAFTIVAVMRVASLANPSWVFTTFDFSAGDGIMIYFDTTTGEISLTHSLTNTTSEDVGTGLNLTANQISFVGLGFNEAGPTCQVRLNGSTATPTVLGSTNTTDPTSQYYISTRDVGPDLPNLSRFWCIAGWSTNIGAAAMEGIYNKLKSRRFTSLP